MKHLYFSFQRQLLTFVLVAVFATVFLFAAHPASAAVRTWDGGGSDGTCGGGAGDGNKWSCDANWSSDTEPGSADVATFDSTSTKNATIDTTISVQGIDINSGYSGTITQGTGITVTVGTGDFDISAGTFTGSDSTIDVNDTFTVSGGTFTSTTGNLQIAGSFTVSSGSFDPSTGTVIADTISSTWNVATNETFNHFTVDRTSTLVVTSGDTLIVTGTLTLTNGSVTTGTIDARSTINLAATFDGGSATIDFGDDGVAQTFTINGGLAPTIRLDSASDANDSIVLAANATIANLTVTSGFSGTIPFSNAGNFTPTFTLWSQAAGTYDASAQSAWNITALTISGGTLTAPTLVTAGATSGTYDVNSSQTFNQFTVDRSSALTLGANDTLVVIGTLILTNGSIATSTARIDARSTITQASTFDGGAAYIDFGDNSVAQTYTINGGSSPIIRFDHASDANDDIDITTTATIDGLETTADFSGAIPLNNPSNFTLTIGTWTQASGTYDASAQSAWNISSSVTISGGTFIAPILVTASGISGTWNINSSQTFNQLTINRSSATTLGANDTLVVTGLLTLTNGSIATATAQIDARANISQANTFDGGAVHIDFGDNSVTQTYTVNGGSTPFIRLDSASDANDDIDVAAAATFDGIEATVSFSGSIPLNNPSNFVLTVADWTQAAGDYNASAQSSWFLNDFNHSAGSFTAPTLITAYSNTETWDLPTTDTFNQFNIDKTNITTIIIPGDDSLAVTGLLTLTNGGFSGIINAQANISQVSGYDGGTSGTLNFANDALAQTYTISGGQTPVITFDDPDDANDDVDVGVATTFDGFTITSGFSGAVPLNNPSDYTLTFAVYTQAGGTLDASAQSAWLIDDFNVSGGTFIAPSLVTAYSSSASWDVNVSQAFNQFTLNKTNATTIILGSGDTMIFTGLLTLTEGAFSGSGSFKPEGNVIAGAASDGSGATLTFSGSAVQTFDISAATGAFNNDIKVNKSGGQLNMLSALVMDGVNQDLIIEEGKLNMAGFALTVNGTNGLFTVEDGGNFILQGAETFTLNTNQPTLSTGSIVTYTGNGNAGVNTYTLTTLKSTYHHLVINSTDGATDIFQPGVALDVNGNLTNTAGTLDVVSGQNYAITLAGNWSNSGTFLARSGTVTLDANTDHTLTGATTWNNLTLQETSNDTDSSTLTLASAITQTIGGTLTLDGLDSTDKLLLAASIPTSAATIDFTGSSTFTGDFLTVTDNTAIDNSSGITLPLNPASSVNGTNTSGWFSPAGVTVSAVSGNTTEAGGTATFTVVLDGLPTANVEVDAVTNDSTEGTVTTNSTMTFTTGNWNTPQTVTVTGVNDDVDDGDVVYTIDVSVDAANTLDDNYDAIDPNDASITNTDNDTAGVTVSAISGNTTEALGTATFTIVLNTEPTGNVEIDSVVNDATEGTVITNATTTFTTETWDTPQTVTVRGANDFLDDGDIAYSIVVDTDDANTADAIYDAIDPADVAVTNTDNDTAGVTVSAISGHTTEAGGTATFTIVLTAQPTGNVEIDAVSNDSSEGVVTTNSTMTFTSVNWLTAQTVTVTGQDDALSDGDVAYSIVVDTDDANTADNAYDAIDPSDVSVTNDDDDTVGVTVSAISGNTTEAGGTATFTVVLDGQPLANVEIDAVSNDSTEGTVTTNSTMTFTTGNWNTPQTVTVTGVNDDVDDGNVAYSIVVDTDDANTLDDAYDSFDPADVTVSNTDNDSAGVTVSAISGNTTEAGVTGTFTVVLNTEPLGNVEIDSASNDSTEGTVTTNATLTFTTENWDTPQTVTVTGVNDDLDDGNIAYIIQTSTDNANTNDATYDGINPADVNVTNTDNDASGVTLVESSGTSLVSETGPTADTFTLVLTAQPTQTVTVDLTYDSDITGSTAQLTFTTGNWNQTQEVTVTAVDDDIDETSPHTGAVSFNFTSTDELYDAVTLGDLSVGVTDNDTSNITVSAISGNTTEAGVTATFTVVLETQPTDNVTIGVATNDSSEGLVTSSATLTFTSGDYSTPHTVTVQGQNDDIDDGNILYAIVLGLASSNDTNYNNVNPADVDVTNTDNDTAGITLTELGGSTDVDELGATSDSYTLVLLSEPTNDVVITLTYDNTQISLNSDTFTFTSLDWDTPQTATVTAVDDTEDEEGSHTSVVSHAVNSVDGNYDVITLSDVSVTILDNDVANLGDGIAPTFVTGAFTEVLNQTEDCATSAQITLQLSARGAVRVYLSNDAEFIDVTAFDFNPDPVLSTSTLSVTGIPWTLAGNSGQQTVYALLASSTNNRLPPIATTVDLGICQSTDDELTETPVTPEDESALPAGYAISPFDGTTIEEVEKIGDGQTFKGEHYDTIYFLEDGKRRPFLNESTYFTWWTNFDQIRTVSDSTLLAYPIGSAMLPKPGSILLQIESDSKVYISEEPNILHQIADDDTAQMLLGSAWQAFVFHLPPTIFNHYLIGEPVQSFAPWDTRHFFTWFGLRINDSDRDGLSDTEEAELGTDPSLNDTDGDGEIDSVEVEDGTDPLKRN